MNIYQIKTTQVVLVPFGDIPLGRLIPRQHLEQCARLFDFGNIEVSESPATGERVVIFQHGIFDTGTDTLAVDRLVIGERKIVVALEGTSEDSDAFFAELADFLADLSSTASDEYLKPVLKVHESEIVAQLDFSVEDLFSPAYFEFMRTTVSREASSDIAEATVRLASLKFRIDYLLQDESILEQRVGLSPKEFTVEPRRGSLLADRMYYSQGPFDTDTHMKLLEELEERIQQSKTGSP